MEDRKDANADPITGEPGAHPVGAAVGGVVGGLAGKGAAEQVNPTVEDAYWRDNYLSRPYVETGAHYEKYQPAYRLGWESRGKYGELDWETAEKRVTEDFKSAGIRDLDWPKARPAVRDAWKRVDENRGKGETIY